MIESEMRDQGETWDDVVDCVLAVNEDRYYLKEGEENTASFTQEFDESYGSADGCLFTVWTNNRVYFPKEYDGSDHVCSVARNPDGVATPHV